MKKTDFPDEFIVPGMCFGGGGDGGGGGGAGPGDAAATDASSAGAVNGADAQSDVASATDASSAGAVNGSDAMSDAHQGEGPGGFAGPSASGPSFGGALAAAKGGLSVAQSAMGILSGTPMGIAAGVVGLASAAHGAMSSGISFGSSSASQNTPSPGAGDPASSNAVFNASGPAVYSKPLAFSPAVIPQATTPSGAVSVASAVDETAKKEQAVETGETVVGGHSDTLTGTDWAKLVGAFVGGAALLK